MILFCSYNLQKWWQRQDVAHISNVENRSAWKEDFVAYLMQKYDVCVYIPMTRPCLDALVFMTVSQFINVTEVHKQVYFSRGGSLRARDAGMSAPLVRSVAGWALLALARLAPGIACDLERSFPSRSASGPAMLRGLPLGPDENHSPDLVRISCCFLHRLHTHITCRETWSRWRWRHRDIYLQGIQVTKGLFGWLLFYLDVTLLS